MEKISILTSQNVSIEYDLALAGERMISTIIDLSIKGGYALSIQIVLEAIHWGGMDYQLLTVLPILLYNPLMEVLMNGQTLGMRLRKIKVIRTDGKELGLGNCLLRWLFRLIDVTMSGGSVALLSISMTDKGQRLGDIAAGTTVIKMQPMLVRENSFMVNKIKDHVVTFDNVKQISDKDIRLIKESLVVYEETQNWKVIEAMALRIKKTYNINSTISAPKLLKTILKDHFYFMDRQ
jgi:uncharacterized RDD family membrane protein YckC